MPLFGRQDVDAALGTAPVVGEFTATTWDLPEAQLLQCTFEVEEEPALELTPPALHPSIPPYVAFNVTHFPDSPVGDFSLAQVRLVCRAGIRPRGYLLGAVCDSAEAVAALRDLWGFDVRHGEVHLSMRHDRVRATALLDGATVLDLTMADAEPIGNADLQMVASLHLVRRTPDDTTGQIIQVDPEYAVHTAERGDPVLGVLDGDALGTGDLLRPTFPIVAFTCRADTDLAPVRFALDPRKPAFEGTTRVDTATV